jgi:putative ABC transport system permease protein
MSFGDSFESAIRAILANKLRSGLTMLGVVIGVGSVIAMIGIGAGTAQKSVENLEIMGSNMLTIMPNWRRGGFSMGSDTPTLKDEDIEAIKTEVPTVKEITGVVRSGAPVKYGSRSHSTQVYGAEPQIALFQGESAIGATVRIRNQNFEVVGVVAYKGGSGFMNPDDQVYIPLNTAKTRLLGKTNPDMIMLQATSGLLQYTQFQVEQILGRTRKNASGEEMFRIMNQGEMIEQVQTQTRLLGYLLAGIASVSLLVGGIGIMNIMLVSVTERTREIGLRKAIGAKRATVLAQFLLESVVMCLLGGVLGILLGAAGVVFVAKALQVPPVVNAQAVTMAFTFSALVGLFFGIYPAMRASRLQPIEALRHE